MCASALQHGVLAPAGHQGVLAPAGHQDVWPHAIVPGESTNQQIQPMINFQGSTAEAASSVLGKLWQESRTEVMDSSQNVSIHQNIYNQGCQIGSTGSVQVEQTQQQTNVAVDAVMAVADARHEQLMQTALLAAEQEKAEARRVAQAAEAEVGRVTREAQAVVQEEQQLREQAEQLREQAEQKYAVMQRTMEAALRDAEVVRREQVRKAYQEGREASRSRSQSSGSERYSDVHSGSSARVELATFAAQATVGTLAPALAPAGSVAAAQATVGTLAPILAPAGSLASTSTSLKGFLPEAEAAPLPARFTQEEMSIIIDAGLRVMAGTRTQVETVTVKPVSAGTAPAEGNSLPAAPADAAEGNANQGGSKGDKSSSSKEATRESAGKPRRNKKKRPSKPPEGGGDGSGDGGDDGNSSESSLASQLSNADTVELLVKSLRKGQEKTIAEVKITPLPAAPQ